jgi:hypothetical protein
VCSTYAVALSNLLDFGLEVHQGVIMKRLLLKAALMKGTKCIPTHLYLLAVKIPPRLTPRIRAVVPIK